jgi:molecular chaperone HscB
VRPIRCWRCSDEHAPSFFCPQCGAVQRLADDSDYFAVLGLPERPDVDLDDLTRRYYELSRRLHPDRYQTGSAEEREASVRATAVLNAAFRTLRDVEARGRYWLRRLGDDLGADNNRVPPGLAAYVFEVQEQLAAVREAENEARQALADELAETRAGLLARRASEREALSALLRAWPQVESQKTSQQDGSGPAREQLKRRLSELSYLRTLARDVQTLLEG